MHTYSCGHGHTTTHAHTNTHANAHTCTYTHMHTYSCGHMHTHTCSCGHMHTHTYIAVDTGMHTCTHILTAVACTLPRGSRTLRRPAGGSPSLFSWFLGHSSETQGCPAHRSDRALSFYVISVVLEMGSDSLMSGKHSSSTFQPIRDSGVAGMGQCLLSHGFIVPHR